jgi:hypothetical protein
MSSQVYEVATNLLKSRETVNRHSYYQLKHFVLGKEHTIQAKLRKCLNELAARHSSLQNLLLAIEDMEDEVLLTDLKIRKLTEKPAESDLHKQWQQIQIRKLTRRKAHTQSSLLDLKKKLKECEEETAFFIHAYQQLEKVEPLKSFDDPIKESKYWNEQFAHELQLRVMLQKPLDLELVKSILALDDKAPIKGEMINILEQIQSRTQTSHKTEMDRAIEVAREAGHDKESECQKESHH